MFAVLLASSVNVQAEVVKWTLNNVNFSDGGTATGFFITGERRIASDIETTAGTVMLFPEEYRHGPLTQGFADYLVIGGVFHAKWGASGFGDRQLQLNTTADLHNDTSGTFAILPGPVDLCGAYDLLCSGETRTDVSPPIPAVTLFRTILPGGTVTASVFSAPIPEASTWLSFGLGFALLAFVSARRRV
jgi:hypothetical protein